MAGANETYTIDIQAAMPEGESVTGKLDALSKSLLGADRSAEQFDAAARDVSKALAMAKASLADTDVQLGEANAQWDELEANANRAAKAFEKAAMKGPVTKEIADSALTSKVALDSFGVTLAALERQSEEARTSSQALALVLGQVRDASREAATAEAATAAAAKELAATEKAAAAAIAKADDEKKSAAEDAAKAAKQAAEDAAKAAEAPLLAAKESAHELGNFRASLATLPGPLGKLASAALAPAQGFQKLSGAMGSSRAASVLAIAGVAALAVAIVAVTVALAAGVVKLAAWAVGLGDVTRSAGLANDAFEAMNPALAGLPIAALSKEFLISSDRLRELAKSLNDAGVAAADMPQALRAAALAERALGQSGSQQFVDNIKAGERAVSDLAAETQSKLGGIVARQMLGLESQSERLSRNVDTLFGGLDVDPALEGFSKLVGLFDESTAAGESMKLVFETVFQPLINMAAEAGTAVEALVLGVLIAFTKIYIGIKPAIKAVKEFFGIEDDATQTNFEAIATAGQALGYVIAFLAVAFGATLAGALALVAPALAVVTGAVYVLVKAIQAVIAINRFFYDTFIAVVNYLKSIDLASIGRAIVQGLINGITSGYSAAVNAVKNVVAGAISAAKGLLGIASPSKVFAGIGENTGEGFAGGVEDSTDAAHAAVGSLVSPDEALNQAAMSGDVAALERLRGQDAAAAPSPVGAAPAAASAAPGGAGGARTVTLLNPVIQLGAGSPKEQAIEFVQWITELLEGDAAQAAGV